MILDLHKGHNSLIFEDSNQDINKCLSKKNIIPKLELYISYFFLINFNEKDK